MRIFHGIGFGAILLSWGIASSWLVASEHLLFQVDGRSPIDNTMFRRNAFDNHPLLSDGGTVVFRAALSGNEVTPGNDTALFAYDAKSDRYDVVAREGELTYDGNGNRQPAEVGGRIGDMFSIQPQTRTFAVGQNGHIGFLTRLTEASIGSDSAFFMYESNGGVKEVIREGRDAPDGAGSVPDLQFFFPRPGSVGPHGEYSFHKPGVPGEVYYYNGDRFVGVAASGEETPSAGETFFEFFEPVFDQTSSARFGAVVQNNRSDHALFDYDGGRLTRVFGPGVSVGALSIDQVHSFERFGQHYLFDANVSGDTNRHIVSVTPQATRVVVERGATAPGLEVPLDGPIHFEEAGRDGHVLFSTPLWSPQGDESRAWFYADDNGVGHVAQIGDLVGPSWENRFVDVTGVISNHEGQVHFLADVDGRDQYSALYHWHADGVATADSLGEKTVIRADELFRVGEYHESINGTIESLSGLWPLTEEKTLVGLRSDRTRTSLAILDARSNELELIAGIGLDFAGETVRSILTSTVQTNERGDVLFEARTENGTSLLLYRTGDDHVRGDLDHDGLLSVDDVNLLSEAISNGEFQQTFDLDESGAVTVDDLVVWVEDIRRTTFGDANLDGQFGSSDLVWVFTRGEYEDDVALNSGWGDGDWNADREFTSRDLVAAFQSGRYESAAAPVPEPLGVELILSCGVCLLCRRVGIGP